MAQLKINSTLIKEAFRKSGINMSAASKLLGYGSSTLSSRLSQKEMTEEMVDKIVDLMNLKKSDIVIFPKSSGGVECKKEAGDTDKIISFICDVGKIQTDMLRELKELHDDMNKFMQAINTNIIDTTAELHQTSENVRNHSVSTNEKMNKIHNLMKYGGK